MDLSSLKGFSHGNQVCFFVSDSRIDIMENNEKQIAPKSAVTWAGINIASFMAVASERKTEKNIQRRHVIIGIRGTLFANLYFLLHTKASN